MTDIQKIEITVLMPAYNAQKYIAAAIGSVLEQSFPHFELLIVNDGSTDNTKDVVEQFNDERIVVLNIPHGGVSAALNSGLAVAKGKYVARFDADDICYPDRLQRQYDFLEQHPDHILTGSDAEYIMEDGTHLFNFTSAGYSDTQIRQNLFVFCPVIHSAVMYRRAAVLEVGGYSVHAHNFEDYLLWVQLAGLGKLHNIKSPLIKVRFNPCSVTIDEKWRGQRFRSLKRTVIMNGSIDEQQGNEIQAIIRKQNTRVVKEGAYHSLCGKKFLTDNYQPARARTHIRRAIACMPLRMESYGLLAVSLLPRVFINWLHKRSPNKL